MVFQGSLLPAIGILLTAWTPQREIVAGMALTLLASAYLLLILRYRRLRVYHFAINGLCYAAYFVAVAF